jgi:hypothetical protein
MLCYTYIACRVITFKTKYKCIQPYSQPLLPSE